jgi:N-acetylmuramoyl-L-alanine amidase
MIKQEYLRMSDQDLLALCIWRESDNQSYDAMLGVGYSIKNRANAPGWWGNSIATVVLHPWQYSSFNANDPGIHRWPHDDEPKWIAACEIARRVLEGVVDDPTDDATSYYDVSISPPQWTNSMEFTVQLDKIRFYRKPARPKVMSA